MGNMLYTISRSHLQLFLSWGLLRGGKTPLRGVPDPQFPAGFQAGPWTLLVKICSLIGRNLWPVAFCKIRKISVTDGRKRKLDNV